MFGSGYILKAWLNGELKFKITSTHRNHLEELQTAYVANGYECMIDCLA